MNRDDIIRMAKDVGMTGLSLIDVGYLKNFAALVAAAEREECAKVCDEIANGIDSSCWAGAETAAEAIRKRGK